MSTYLVLRQVCVLVIAACINQYELMTGNPMRTSRIVRLLMQASDLISMCLANSETNVNITLESCKPSNWYNAIVIACIVLFPIIVDKYTYTLINFLFFFNIKYSVCELIFQFLEFCTYHYFFLNILSVL